MLTTNRENFTFSPLLSNKYNLPNSILNNILFHPMLSLQKKASILFINIFIAITSLAAINAFKVRVNLKFVLKNR